MPRSMFVQRILPIFILVALLIAQASFTYAALPADPYADAVDTTTGGLVVLEFHFYASQRS